uniref:Uncharacterized protein n=1 Tax=Aegilops tauschii subsp. strangulata TaxID=200361 RepID=A0A453AE95_AEGTS
MRTGWLSTTVCTRTPLRRHAGSRFSKPMLSSLKCSMLRITSSGSVSTNSLISPMMSSRQPTQTSGSKQTPSEFFLPGSVLSSGFRYENLSLDALPATMDWRAKGAVTPVKDQVMVKIKAAREDSWMMPSNSLSRTEALLWSPTTHILQLTASARLDPTVPQPSLALRMCLPTTRAPL